MVPAGGAWWRYSLTDVTKAVHASAGNARTGPPVTLESRTASAATTGDRTSTHAPFPPE